MADSPYEVTASDRPFQGRRMSVRVDEVRLQDGTEVVRETVEHPGAVAIVPVLADGSVVLIRQWRHAVGGELLEIPAGTLEPGEDPADCARRELVEETGFEAGRIEPVVSFYTSPGILDEKLHVFLARDLRPAAMDLDEGEVIEPVTVPWAEALAMCRDGRVEDAKTLVGLLAATPAAR